MGKKKKPLTERFCEVCRKDFYAVAQAHYCSSPCRQKHYRAKKKEEQQQGP